MLRSKENFPLAIWARVPYIRQPCLRPCHGLSCCSPSSYCGGPASIAGQSMWIFLDKVTVRQDFLRPLPFPLLISFHKYSVLILLPSMLLLAEAQTDLPAEVLLFWNSGSFDKVENSYFFLLQRSYILYIRAVVNNISFA
jgi:hypothetical protein